MKNDLIHYWASLCINEDDAMHIHENEMDDGTVIGIFSVDESLISEMGEVGRIESSGRFYVYIRSNEGMTPHFHIFNNEGRNRRTNEKNKGFHTCVEIRRNAYFKHGPYTDDLSQKMREALDVFMRQLRTEDKYNSGVGKSNFEHTIDQWNDNNAQERTSPNRVDPKSTEQPDYTTIS